MNRDEYDCNIYMYHKKKNPNVRAPCECKEQKTGRSSSRRWENHPTTNRNESRITTTSPLFFLTTKFITLFLTMKHTNTQTHTIASKPDTICCQIVSVSGNFWFSYAKGALFFLSVRIKRRETRDGYGKKENALQLVFSHWTHCLTSDCCALMFPQEDCNFWTIKTW